MKVFIIKSKKHIPIIPETCTICHFNFRPSAADLLSAMLIAPDLKHIDIARGHEATKTDAQDKLAQRTGVKITYGAFEQIWGHRSDISGAEMEVPEAA